MDHIQEMIHAMNTMMQLVNCKSAFVKRSILMRTFNVMTQNEMEKLNGGALLGVGRNLIFILKRMLDNFKRPKY